MRTIEAIIRIRRLQKALTWLDAGFSWTDGVRFLQNPEADDVGPANEKLPESMGVNSSMTSARLKNELQLVYWKILLSIETTRSEVWHHHPSADLASFVGPTWRNIFRIVNSAGTRNVCLFVICRGFAVRDDDDIPALLFRPWPSLDLGLCERAKCRLHIEKILP